MTRLSLVLLVASTLAGCGADYVVGVWTGTTTGCSPDTANGTSLTISVANSASTGKVDGQLMTTLGLSDSTGIVTCKGSPSTIDRDSSRVRFEQVRTCSGQDVGYSVDATLGADDTLSGTITAGSSTCSFALARTE